MTDLTPVSSFDPVPELETNTVALAGPGGPMNSQGQALLNRTKFLDDKIDQVVDDLANSTDPSKGAGMVGFKQSGVGAVARTVKDKLLEGRVNVKDFGAVGDGVTDDSAAFTLAFAYAATNGYELHCSSTSIHALNRVQAVAGLHLFGNGATIIPTTAYAAGTTTKYGLIEATAIDDVKISGFKGRLRSTTDRVVYVRGDTCTNLYIEDLDIVCNIIDGIQVRGGDKIFIRRNKARLNPSGTGPTAAIRVFGKMTNWEISDNDVAGFKVTKPHEAIGVQPAGDLWGGNGIAVTNGGDWPGDSGGQGAWKNITGSFTVPVSSPSTYVVADAQIVNIADWEGAAALTWNTVTGDGDGVTDPLVVTFQVGQMTISGISAGWAGLVISYQALYFGTTPRFGKIDRNKVVGMLYAGLTLINARDVVATNNDLRLCSDLGWDPEGCIRTTIVGGQWHDCGTGGALAGGGSHIIDVEIYSDSTAIIFGGNNIAYQGLAQCAMVGLRGGNLIQGVRHFHTVPDNTSSTFIGNGDTPPGLTIQSCHSNLRLNNVPLTNASRLTINGNSFAGRFGVINSSKVAITDNVSRSPTQGGIKLDGVSNFRVSGNTIYVTTGVYGESSGVRYLNCTNGYMGGNFLLSSTGNLYNNSGGNTNVIVTKPTLSGSGAYPGETIAAGASGTIRSVTITGLVLGDFVDVASLNVNLNGCELVTYVSGGNTISYYIRNNTAGSVTLGSGTATIQARNA
jgi:hypothetical protein